MKDRRSIQAYFLGVYDKCQRIDRRAIVELLTAMDTVSLEHYRMATPTLARQCEKRSEGDGARTF
jgi:hypothetical protein